jgi:hypothetical protein
MRPEDLKLFELIRVDEGAGTLHLKNRRVLIVDADALGVLRKELITSLGLPDKRAPCRLPLDWTCADNYHLCIDTSIYPLPELAERLILFVQRKLGIKEGTNPA